MNGSYFGKPGGKVLSANERVRFSPESIDLYKDTVTALTVALSNGGSRKICAV